MTQEDTGFLAGAVPFWHLLWLELGLAGTEAHISRLVTGEGQSPWNQGPGSSCSRPATAPRLLSDRSQPGSSVGPCVRVHEFVRARGRLYAWVGWCACVSSSCACA